jgi:hypothetical protein
MPWCESCGCHLSLKRIVRNLMRRSRKINYAIRLLDGNTVERTVYWLCGPCGWSAEKDDRRRRAERSRFTE